MMGRHTRSEALFYYFRLEDDWRQSFFPVVLPHSRMLPNKTHAFRPRKLLSGDGGLGQGDGV